MREKKSSLFVFRTHCLRKFNCVVMLCQTNRIYLRMDTSVPSRFTRREIFYLNNTLLCLVKAIEKRYATIDLRNETCVTGKITEVDGYMNVTLTDAALYDTDGDFRYFPIMYVQARNIRNVHLPDNVNVRKAIKSQVTKEPVKAKKGKMTFKESRAKKQQKETLELIKKMKEERKERTEGLEKVLPKSPSES